MSAHGCCAITLVALALFLARGVPAYADGAATPGPVVWQEGEAFASVSIADKKDATSERPPASGGKALYTRALEPKDASVTYEVNLPAAVPDAKLVFRFARRHWREGMQPKPIALELSCGGQSIKKDIAFGDTKDWGMAPVDWSLLTVKLGQELPRGKCTLKLTSLGGVDAMLVDGFFIAPAAWEITAAELSDCVRLEVGSDGYLGLKGPGLVFRQDAASAVRLVARPFAEALGEVQAVVEKAPGDLAALTELKRSSDPATGVCWLDLSTPKFSDGQYVLDVKSQNPRLELRTRIVMAGEFLATMDRRLEALKVFAATLQKTTDERAARCAADFKHAIEYLEKGWESLPKNLEPALLLANMKKAAEQCEETMERLKSGRDPYAGRAGDFRRAFVSAASGLLEQYRVYVPSAYEKAEKVPFVLLLHGGGGDEDYFPDMANGAILKVLEARGYLAVVPKANSWYAGPGQKDLVQLVELARREYPKIDPVRMYCTGISRGGFGTYELATAYPDLFAAICCVSGTGSAEKAAALKNVPMLILQGGMDDVVPPAGAEKMAAKLRELGYTYDLEIFPTFGHDYHPNEYLKITLDWFDKFTKSAGAKKD